MGQGQSLERNRFLGRPRPRQRIDRGREIASGWPVSGHGTGRGGLGRSAGPAVRGLTLDLDPGTERAGAEGGPDRGRGLTSRARGPVSREGGRAASGAPPYLGRRVGVLVLAGTSRRGRGLGRPPRHGQHRQRARRLAGSRCRRRRGVGFERPGRALRRVSDPGRRPPRRQGHRRASADRGDRCRRHRAAQTRASLCDPGRWGRARARGGCGRRSVSDGSWRR